ncbi:MAG: wax ester/triacylglycerol synthase family O-acyltransferase [Myxococcota bacterium]|nr:wax ester/triacylglycerol synthase family O-acyltransferase [Myxococcota bacterium]
MQQLSGMDAAFLYFEAKNAPTHIASLGIYDQTTAHGGKVTFKGILKNVEKRLHLARCFRQKVVRLPFDLDHPYWIEDPEFDLEFHVRHIALPHPGDWRQLCIQAARIHARPLDLSKPLWEMYVIEGLDNVEGVPKGSFAVMTKIHHAAIDGVSGAEMMAAIHDIEPDAEPEPPTEKWVPERDPSVLELGMRSVAQNVRDPFRFAKVMGRTIPPIAKRMMADPAEEVEGSGDVPRTRFNGTVTPHRVIEGRVFSLQDVRDIRKRVPGATVNDVILTVCSGAMRRYLEDKNELPRESLVAMAPISVRRDDEKGTAGNRISSMSVTLYSHIEDPVERLKRVHEGTRNSKAVAEAMGADTMTDISQVLPGTFSGLAARAYSRLGLANRVSPFLNTVITNVPGPQVPLYFTGGRIVGLFGLGPVMDGMGIIHPVFSFSGRISVSVTACRDMLPDPGFYAQCLQDSFDELLEAATKTETNADE